MTKPNIMTTDPPPITASLQQSDDPLDLYRLLKLASLTNQAFHGATKQPAESVEESSAEFIEPFLNSTEQHETGPYQYVLKQQTAQEGDRINLSRLENVGQGHRFCDEEFILGKGTYGVVKLMADKKSGRRYAVKSLNKNIVASTGMESQVQLEIRAQQAASHPNIVKCWNVVSDTENIYLILDYCKNGDLFRRLRSAPNRRLDEREAFRLFMQLISGLSHLHNLGLCHRDLKLENLLLDEEYNLKIADFGWVARINGPRRNHNFCGTLDYLSPEMILGGGHDWRVDVWAVGILLYEILAGKPPFLSTRHFDLLHRILNVKVHDEFDGPATGIRRRRSSIKPDALATIKRFLHPDPDFRIAFEDIFDLEWVQRMLRELYNDTLRLWQESTTAPAVLSPPESTSSPSLHIEVHHEDSGASSSADVTPASHEGQQAISLSAVLTARSQNPKRAPSVRGRLQHKRSSTTESAFQWKGEAVANRPNDSSAMCSKLNVERSIRGAARAAAYDDIYVTGASAKNVLRMYHRSTDFTRRRDFSPVCALLTSEPPTVHTQSARDTVTSDADTTLPSAEEDSWVGRFIKQPSAAALQRRWITAELPFFTRPAGPSSVRENSVASMTSSSGNAPAVAVSERAPSLVQAQRASPLALLVAAKSRNAAAIVEAAICYQPESFG